MIGYMDVENRIWEISQYLTKRYGYRKASIMIDPLTWYIGTGRASVTFLHMFMDTKPFVIGRILAKGGSHDEVIQRIRKRIGLPAVTW